MLSQKTFLISKARGCLTGELIFFKTGRTPLKKQCPVLYMQLPMPRYGVKNKGTTEQAFFNCNICECELKSVVTLRAHCKGTQHVRKALQKKKV